MKSLLIVVLSLISLSSFAGTGTVYSNEALGFSLYESVTSDNISICNSADKCFDFDMVSINEKTGVRIYKEVFGSCEVEVSYYSKDFAQGKTENDFMLSVGFSIVQVVKGESRCVLAQETGGARSLTGIYN